MSEESTPAMPDRILHLLEAALLLLSVGVVLGIAANVFGFKEDPGAQAMMIGLLAVAGVAVVAAGVLMFIYWRRTRVHYRGGEVPATLIIDPKLRGPLASFRMDEDGNVVQVYASTDQRFYPTAGHDGAEPGHPDTSEQPSRARDRGTGDDEPADPSSDQYPDHPLASRIGEALGDAHNWVEDRCLQILDGLRCVRRGARCGTVITSARSTSRLGPNERTKTGSTPWPTRSSSTPRFASSTTWSPGTRSWEPGCGSRARCPPRRRSRASSRWRPTSSSTNA